MSPAPNLAIHEYWVILPNILPFLRLLCLQLHVHPIATQVNTKSRTVINTFDIAAREVSSCEGFRRGEGLQLLRRGEGFRRGEGLLPGLDRAFSATPTELYRLRGLGLTRNNASTALLGKVSDRRSRQGR